MARFMLSKYYADFRIDMLNMPIAVSHSLFVTLLVAPLLAAMAGCKSTPAPLNPNAQASASNGPNAAALSGLAANDNASLVARGVPACNP